MNEKEKKQAWIESLSFLIFKCWFDNVEFLFLKTEDLNFLRIAFCEATEERRNDIYIELLALYLYYCDFTAFISLGEEKRDEIIDEVIKSIIEILFSEDTKNLLGIFKKSNISYEHFLNISLSNKFVEEYEKKVNEYSKYEKFYADKPQGTLIFAIAENIANLLNHNREANFVYSVYFALMNQFIASFQEFAIDVNSLFIIYFVLLFIKCGSEYSHNGKRL